MLEHCPDGNTDFLLTANPSLAPHSITVAKDKLFSDCLILRCVLLVYHIAEFKESSQHHFYVAAHLVLTTWNASTVTTVEALHVLLEFGTRTPRTRCTLTVTQFLAKFDAVALLQSFRPFPCIEKLTRALTTHYLIQMLFTCNGCY